MALIMSHRDWLKMTDGGRTAIRSKELKQVDAALEAYHTAPSDTLKNAVMKALVNFMQIEGPGYKTSKRNQFGAIDDLYKQLSGQTMAKGGAAEMLALSAIRDESRAVVTDLFRGKKLTWKPTFIENLKANYKLIKAGKSTFSHGKKVVGLIQGTGQTTTAAATNALGVTNPLTNAHSFVREIVPPELFDEVMDTVASHIPEFLVDFANDAAPFLGVGVAGAKTIKSAISLISSQVKVVKGRKLHENTLATDDPEAAIRSLLEILERTRTSNQVKLAINGAAFGGKLAGVLADGGTATNVAISFAASIAKLAQLIAELARDVYERREANRLMNTPGSLDGTIFQHCPILGCYMICCVPTSVLVNSIFDQFYEPGMMNRVEFAVRKNVEPLRKLARKAIGNHRFCIPELLNFPGVMKVSKWKLFQMARKNGKTAIGQDAIGWDDAGAGLGG